MKFKEHLESIPACEGAIKWVKNRSIKRAFKECQRGDWMLWYAYRNREKLGLEDMKLITLAKVKCARLVQYLMKDERSLKALDVAEKFALGKATGKELSNAANEAADVAANITIYHNTYVYTAKSAAYAAAYAADTVIDASYAVVYTVEAAVYIFTNYAEILQECADICRKVFKDVELKY